MKIILIIVVVLCMGGCASVDEYTKKVADRRHAETQPDPTFQQRVADSIARGDRWYVTPSGTIVVLREDSVSVIPR